MNLQAVAGVADLLVDLKAPLQLRAVEGAEQPVEAPLLGRQRHPLGGEAGAGPGERRERRGGENVFLHSAVPRAGMPTPAGVTAALIDAGSGSGRSRKLSNGMMMRKWAK